MIKLLVERDRPPTFNLASDKEVARHARISVNAIAELAGRYHWLCTYATEEKLFSLIVVDDEATYGEWVKKTTALHRRPQNPAHRPGAGPVAGGIGGPSKTGFDAVRESADGPQRRFTAAQQHVGNGGYRGPVRRAWAGVRLMGRERRATCVTRTSTKNPGADQIRRAACHTPALSGDIHHDRRDDKEADERKNGRGK
jgi:hypothetical protein